MISRVVRSLVDVADMDDFHTAYWHDLGFTRAEWSRQHRQMTGPSEFPRRSSYGRTGEIWHCRTSCGRVTGRG